MEIATVVLKKKIILSFCIWQCSCKLANKCEYTRKNKQWVTERNIPTSTRFSMKILIFQYHTLHFVRIECKYIQFLHIYTQSNLDMLSRAMVSKQAANNIKAATVFHF